MNKKIIASVLAVASVLTVSAGALADDNITVTVNGNNVSFVEITPFIENDHTLVPMREIFEALGLSQDINPKIPDAMEEE